MILRLTESRWLLLCLLTLLGLSACSHTTMIKSVPEGAKVWVNDHFRGETPVTYTTRSGTPQALYVKIEKEGYVTQNVTIEKSYRADISLLLLIPGIIPYFFSARLEDPDARHEWTRGIDERLLKIEREVFLADHYKAFVIFVDPCNICRECVGQGSACARPDSVRPSGEGLGVDIYATARAAGYEIHVLQEKTDEMDRFGFLMIEKRCKTGTPDDLQCKNR